MRMWDFSNSKSKGGVHLIGHLQAVHKINRLRALPLLGKFPGIGGHLIAMLFNECGQGSPEEVIEVGQPRIKRLVGPAKVNLLNRGSPRLRNTSSAARVFFCTSGSTSKDPRTMENAIFQPLIGAYC